MATELPESLQQFLDEKFKLFREKFVGRSAAVEGALRILDNPSEEHTNGELLHLVQELATEFKETEKKTYTDPTTGHFNRSAFDAALQAKAKNNYDDITFAAAQGETADIKPTAIVFLDLNYLKQLNNISYANGGDKAIKYLSNYVSSKLGQDDIFARFGGDEFGIVMHGKTAEEAEKIIKPILQQMAKDSLDPVNGCICTDDHTKVSAPVQVSAAFGCADLLTKLPETEVSGTREEDVSKLIHLSVGAAQIKETEDKKPSKKYAASIKGGFPQADDRQQAEVIVRAVLENKFGYPKPDESRMQRPPAIITGSIRRGAERV